MIDALTSALNTAIGLLIGWVIGAAIAFIFWSTWGWFVVPLGLPHINFFHAWGLVVMFTLVVPDPYVGRDIEGGAVNALSPLIRLLFVWPIGYVLHLLM